MDITGMKNKIQRMQKVAEESYKKMNQMMEQIQDLQDNVEETSEQVDRMEYDIAEQRALIRAIAEQQEIDIEAVLEEADLPEHEEKDPAQMATSRPSADE